MAWVHKTVGSGPMVKCAHCPTKWSVTTRTPRAHREWCKTCQAQTCGKLGCAFCPWDGR